MSEKLTFSQQFQRMPRALQWGAIGAGVIILFLIWDQTLRRVAAGMNDSADRIESQVATLRAAYKRIGEFQSPQLQEVVTALGPVQVPHDEVKGTAAFNEIVNQVLEKYHASNASFSMRSKGRLGKAALPAITPPDGRIDRLAGELKFEATPADALAIIAELDSNPNIESVTSVRLIRDAAPRIKVNLAIEAWVVARGSTPGPALQAQGGTQ